MERVSTLTNFDDICSIEKFCEDKNISQNTFIKNVINKYKEKEFNIIKTEKLNSNIKSFYINKDLKDILRFLAFKNGASISVILNSLINKGIEEKELLFC